MTHIHIYIAYVRDTPKTEWFIKSKNKGIDNESNPDIRQSRIQAPKHEALQRTFFFYGKSYNSQ